MNNRLFIITASLGSGGLEKITATIANYYVEKNWDVFILTLLNPENNIFQKLNDKVRVINFQWNNKVNKINKAFKINKWIKFIREQLRLFHPSNILSMTIKLGAISAIANNKEKARLVVREISDPKSKVRSQFVNKICFHFCKKADGFIFQTNWEKNCFPKKLQVKGKIIPNPISINCMAADKKNNVIVTMGRLLNKQKKHDILLNAFAIFLKKHPEFVLEIYGEGPDLEKDKTICGNLKITERVLFKGAVKNVDEKIVNAKMFVLTSEFEGLSNALLEAFLMGIPCISSDWPGVEDVIKDKYNGLIFERNNVNMLAEYMCQIAENKVDWETYSKRAKQNKDIYAQENVLLEYAKIIEGRE